jgi:4Fe-4S ferredoxin
MILHTKHYSLTVNKSKCTGCGVCMEICPKEAIQATRTPKEQGEKAKTPTVTIDEEKCHYCGVCVALCPFGALTLKINGEESIPVVGSESFPQLIRDILVDETKCGVDCLEVEDPCPLDLIKVSVRTKDGKEVTDATSIKNKKNLQVTVEIDKESCPCCRQCETKFPSGVIQVKKMFEGTIRINSEKCPEGCHDCVDVCPFPDVLIVSEDGKVQVNEQNCIYCGACRIACPEEDALELARIRVRHTEIHSGTWNKALEKLASTKAVTKELQSKSARRLHEAVKKRCPPEVLENDF